RRGAAHAVLPGLDARARPRSAGRPGVVRAGGRAVGSGRGVPPPAVGLAGRRGRDPVGPPRRLRSARGRPRRPAGRRRPAPRPPRGPAGPRLRRRGRPAGRPPRSPRPPPGPAGDPPRRPPARRGAARARRRVTDSLPAPRPLPEEPAMSTTDLPTGSGPEVAPVAYPDLGPGA